MTKDGTQYFVEVVNIKTREVASRQGPMSERMSDKREMTMLMRIDTANWFVRVVEEEGS